MRFAPSTPSPGKPVITVSGAPYGRSVEQLAAPILPHLLRLLERLLPPPEHADLRLRPRPQYHPSALSLLHLAGPGLLSVGASHAGGPRLRAPLPVHPSKLAS